jgi:hypothetical protein
MSLLSPTPTGTDTQEARTGSSCEQSTAASRPSLSTTARRTAAASTGMPPLLLLLPLLMADATGAPAASRWREASPTGVP